MIKGLRIHSNSAVALSADEIMLPIMKNWARYKSRDDTHSYVLRDIITSLWHHVSSVEDGRYIFDIAGWDHRSRQMLVARVCTIMLCSNYTSWTGDLELGMNITFFMDLVRNERSVRT